MVPFSKVQQVLKDRSDTPLGDIVTRAWLSREASSLGGKRTALAQQIRSGGEAYPATRLLQAALSQQETKLQAAKTAWKARTGSTFQATEEGKELRRCLADEARSSHTTSTDQQDKLSSFTQFEQALCGWTPGWSSEELQLRSLTHEAWANIAPINLGLNLDAAQWQAPPTNTWLYAGYVDCPQRARNLAEYSERHGVPILVLTNESIPWPGSGTPEPTLRWPLPPTPRFSRQATAAMEATNAKEQKKTETKARLVLLGARHRTGADVTQPDLPDWMREWPKMYRKYQCDSPAEQAQHTTVSDALKLALAHDLCGRPAQLWWWQQESGPLGQALHSGLLTKETGQALAANMPRYQAARLE